MQFKDNMPGKKWIKGFIKRMKLSTRMPDTIKPVRAKVTCDDINDYFDNLEETLRGVEPEHIFNYDETYLADDPGAKVILVSRGFGRVERQQEHSKLRYSVMFCASPQGSMLAPMVVYKASNLYEEWMQNGQSNACYAVTKSGWFDMETFEQWFFEVFLPHVKDIVGPIVLIGDNLASHFSPEVSLCFINIRYEI